MNYFPVELHCHTMHSDGSFTVEELCKEAKSKQLDLIALTDHNTKSGVYEITNQLEERTVPVIKGIEWTTYFGHMLVLGAKKEVDWRQAMPDTIDTYIKEIKEQGGLVGLAHPFDLGSPMCTGGHWDFKVKDWNNVDYIEVWHEDFPSVKTPNLRSLEFWSSLLDKGHKIAPAYGKDWHGFIDEKVPYACTFLGVNSEKITSELAIDAIRKGRTAISMGPRFVMYLNDSERIYHIGDSVSQGWYTVYFDIDYCVRKSVWDKYNIKIDEIRLVGKGGKIIDTFQVKSETTKKGVDLKKGWIRSELWGEASGKKCCIAITGAVYVE